ncbi:DUF5331 domain-containing protein [Calothrix sp. PCC 7507]|uniref:DUF5331 domain-containing protein n=1 Tax=Calothrix sp. PCC 7507 TaxID=99598 RepID=UPI00029EE3DA|nr:DUF5331 domain-containing protein [Calothrix sp. PCC 7507]AFY32791.1 hypothetical protein Cal7507_2360 [Calothrix sp. PCC 7507]
MNIQQLRQSLKMKWLSYYQQNRTWLVKMRVWGTYDGLRRPSSGFILATLSVLEPQFDQIIPFILDLNNNPDQIVAALGLNFNPDQELSLTSSELSIDANQIPDDSPLETYVEDNSVTSVAVTTAATESPDKAAYNFQPGQGFARREKVVSSNTFAVKGTSDRQPVSTRESSTKTLPFDKPPSGFPRQQKPGRGAIAQLPSRTSLAMLNQVKRPTKTVPPLSASKVSSNNKTLSSLTVAIQIPGDGKPIKMHLQDSPDKAKPSPPSNASSLASWIDEFCQGAEWDSKAAIFTRF